MNGKERFLATMQNKQPDFPARIPILMQFAAEYIGATYGAFCSDHRVKVEGNICCAEDFGLDLVGVMSDPYSETQGFGAEIKYLDKGVPQCLRPPLADTKAFAVLATPDPYSSTRMWNVVQAVKAYHEQVGDRYAILGWVEGPAAEAADLRGISNFMLDLIDDPDYAGELMDRCIEVAINFARAQIEAGADIIGVGDAIASQVSPALYENHILPRQHKLFSAIREMGAYSRLHICGNITHLLDGIAALPLDILDVDYFVDMQLVRKKIGGSVALAGNLDPVKDILMSNPDAIRQASRQIFQQVGHPYLVNAGCEIPPGTPEENLRALCEPLYV